MQSFFKSSDLELTLHLDNGDHSFAAECKWRSRFNDGGSVQWCDAGQLERYHKFAREKKMSVL